MLFLALFHRSSSSFSLERGTVLLRDLSDSQNFRRKPSTRKVSSSTSPATTSSCKVAASSILDGYCSSLTLVVVWRLRSGTRGHTAVSPRTLDVWESERVKYEDLIISSPSTRAGVKTEAKFEVDVRNLDVTHCAGPCHLHRGEPGLSRNANVAPAVYFTDFHRRWVQEHHLLLKRH